MFVIIITVNVLYFFSIYLPVSTKICHFCFENLNEWLFFLYSLDLIERNYDLRQGACQVFWSAHGNSSSRLNRRALIKRNLVNTEDDITVKPGELFDNRFPHFSSGRSALRLLL